MTETERREALQVGDLVFYDAMHGPVPCRIVGLAGPLRFDHGDRLVLRVTGGRYAYPRGYEFTTRRGVFVQKRASLH